MCEFSHEGSFVKDINYNKAIIGSRFWIYSFKRKELRSLNRDFKFENVKTETNDIPDLNGDLGIYSYNYNNNYNNNYYNNNYYNHYNYYNYNYISGIIKAYGSSIIHEKGQRSQKIEILAFLSLKDHENKKFLKDFNSKVEQLANKFGVKILPFQFGENPITNYNLSLAK